MEDTTRLKIILLGLFLAALALGYLIFSQRTATQEFQVDRPIQQMDVTPGVPAGGEPSTLGQTAVSPTAAQPAPATTGQPGITNSTKGGQPVPPTEVSTLPNTGVPSVLVGIFSASAALAGWKLRGFSLKI